MDPTEQLRRLSALDTPTLSDALDRLGIVGQIPAIKPLSTTFSLTGRAFTVRYEPTGTESGSVGDYIDDLGEGDVAVLANAGRMDTTVWGDLLTETAHRRHVAGTVIDGVCRDGQRILELDYPVFARGRWMRTGKDRVRVESYQQPVSLAGVRVQPGDLLRGDGDGVVVLPASHVDIVLDVAQQISVAEEAIRHAVRDGQSLRDAREHIGYHQLQRRETTAPADAARTPS